MTSPDPQTGTQPDAQPDVHPDERAAAKPDERAAEGTDAQAEALPGTGSAAGPGPEAAGASDTGPGAGTGTGVGGGAGTGESADVEPEVRGQAAVTAAEPASPDRVYRSGGGLAGGVVVLALAAWLGIDALVRGEGSTPWLSLAGLLFLVPLVTAFTLRPAVYANDHRLRVRNPFRTITLPWAAVSSLRSGYSNEVFDQEGVKYQLWAIPVSLRARKRAGRSEDKASRQQMRAGTTGSRGSGPGLGLGLGRTGPSSESSRARGDKTMDDLRELQETSASMAEAQGAPEVRWAYEVAGPALAGLVLLVVLLAVG